jgi:acid phosphatase type 7
MMSFDVVRPVPAKSRSGGILIRRVVILVVALAPMPGVGTLPALGASWAVLLAAGDIARCDSDRDEATARLLDGLPGTVAAIGDTAYHSGSGRGFRLCYDPTWGRHKSRTRPAVGNPDYRTAGAAGYFAYFGAQAGEPQKGYYSYNLGSWHIIVLNSNCDEVGGCGAGSPQLTWLQDDLQAHPVTCTLAYWHHPRFQSWSAGEGMNKAADDSGMLPFWHHSGFSSSSTGEGMTMAADDSVLPFWQALYDADADVVLAGHRHNYERFAPMDPTGTRDDARGMRQFIVGTGGGGLFRFLEIAPNSEVQDDKTFGVLKLVLREDGYSWTFLPVAGQTFTDSGSDLCH